MVNLGAPFSGSSGETVATRCPFPTGVPEYIVGVCRLWLSPERKSRMDSIVVMSVICCRCWRKRTTCNSVLFFLAAVSGRMRSTSSPSNSRRWTILVYSSCSKTAISSSSRPTISVRHVRTLSSICGPEVSAVASASDSSSSTSTSTLSSSSSSSSTSSVESSRSFPGVIVCLLLAMVV